MTVESRCCEVLVTEYKRGISFGRFQVGDLRNVGLTPFSSLLGGEVPDTDSLLFLDTETTGLAGGTGTVAFLVGVGYYAGEGFVVKQYLMRDFDEEYPMLSELTTDLLKRPSLVTYNGKAFDMNLLSTRYIMNGIRAPRVVCHLDLLYLARRVWRRSLENCRLSTIESVVLGHRRDGDVPGALIPQLYFDYLRSGKRETLDAVLIHNRQDIVAMAALTRYLSELAEASSSADPAELLGIAGFFLAAGDNTRAEGCLLRCIGLSPRPAIARDALVCLAGIKKRERDLSKAVGYWKQLLLYTPAVGVYPFIELAKYYEHTERDFVRAKEYADKAQLIAEGTLYKGSRVRAEIAARRERLKKKALRSEK